MSPARCKKTSPKFARVGDIVRQLGASVDFRLGLVGFGTSPPHKNTTAEGQAHVHSTLMGTMTENVQAFTSGLNEPVASGGVKPGFSAVRLGTSDAMGFRPESPRDQTLER